MKRRRVRIPHDDAAEYCRQCKDRDGFQVKFINDYIGRGVFTTRNFMTGEFLLEYAGEHISAAEGEEREAKYPCSLGSFLFFFGKNKCVDATYADHGLGRLVNDDISKKANAIMRIIEVDGRQHLCLFAKHNIHAGSELRYDYGIPDLPWRKASHDTTETSRMTTDEEGKCTEVLHSARQQEDDHVTVQWSSSPNAKKISHISDLGDTGTGMVLTEKKSTLRSASLCREEIQDVAMTDTTVCADQTNDTVKGKEIDTCLSEDLIVNLRTTSELYEASCPSIRDDGLFNAEETSVADNSTDQPSTELNKDKVTEVDLDLEDDGKEGTKEGEQMTESSCRDVKNLGDPTSTAVKINKISDKGPQGVNEDLVSEGERLTDTPDLVENLKSCCNGRGSDGKSLTDQNSSAVGKDKFSDIGAEGDDKEEINEGESLALLESLMATGGCPNADGDSDGKSLTDQNSSAVEKNKFSDISAEGGNKEIMNEGESIALLESLMATGGCPDADGDDDGKNSAVMGETPCCFSPDESGEEVMILRNQGLRNDASSVIEHVSDSCDSDSESNDPSYMPVKYTFNVSGSDSDVSVIIPLQMSSNKLDAGCSHPKSSKPKRPCPFCGVFQAKLTRHIQLKHKEIEEVANAMKAPKKERLQMFENFKKRGILEVNKSQAKEANPQYLQERKCTTGSGKLVMCGNCKGFYHPKFFGRHRKLCMADSAAATVCVPLTLLSKLDESEHADGFFKEILCKIRDDDIGKLCKRDALIALVGKRLWMKNRLKTDKKGEVRKSVMTSMRRLGSLYFEFKKQEEELGPFTVKEGTSADMFLRKNYSHLEQAIVSCTLKGEGCSTDDLKHGLKTALYYLIKKSCKILKGTYLIDDEDEKAESVDKFLDVFDLNHDSLFGDASYAMSKNRNEKLRKPEALPSEEDILKVREYTMTRMKAIVDDSYNFFDSHAYVELRDLLVCRLTLFNARRGGEPCRLRMIEWQDADSNVWISEEDVEKLDDPLDKALAKTLKIAYQTGKGNRHLVPVLLPSDTINPLRLLTKEESRATAGIAEVNPYVFASTQGSLYHVSGWHAVHGVCDTLNLERGHLLTATKNRHRVSTIYATMEVPESERRYFYDHMGHSKQINQDIYQAPLALMEVIKVGRSLNAIDGMVAEESDQHGATASPADSGLSPPCDKPCDTEHSVGSTTAASSEHWPSFSVDDVEDSLSTASEDSDDYPALHSRSRAHSTTPFGTSSSNNKARKYTKWSKAEEHEVMTYFKGYIQGQAGKKLPGKKEIEPFLKQSTLRYDWTTVKTKVMNEQAKAMSLATRRKEEMQMPD